MRHQSPSTSATHYVQNRIEDIAIGPGPWSSTSTLPLRQQWRNQRPLCIIQVGRVGLSGHADKSTRPFSKHSLRGVSKEFEIQIERLKIICVARNASGGNCSRANHSAASASSAGLRVPSTTSAR